MDRYLAFGIPAGGEWLIILVVILLLFGGTKIPQLMRGVGKGVGELQRGLEEGKRTFERELSAEEEKANAEKLAEKTPGTVGDKPAVPSPDKPESAKP